MKSNSHFAVFIVAPTLWCKLQLVFQYLINHIINMPLQYIYTGYSKCGTKTMAEVFRILGFKVCDFEETMLDITTEWIEFIDGRKTHEQRIELLKKMFQDFDACMGAPCYVYWQELMTAFPDAKCIFYQREENSWAKSCVTQLEKPFQSFPGNLPDWIHTSLYNVGFYPGIWKTQQTLYRGFMCDTLSDNADWSVNWYGAQYSFNMTRARRAYRSHNANFLMNCPEDKRLVIEDMDCGWQVICEFVKKPVPGVEYRGVEGCPPCTLCTPWK